MQAMHKDDVLNANGFNITIKRRCVCANATTSIVTSARGSRLTYREYLTFPQVSAMASMCTSDYGRCHKARKTILNRHLL
jgi:hypothetical protein